jgi:hypothetical protein
VLNAEAFVFSSVDLVGLGLSFGNLGLLLELLEFDLVGLGLSFGSLGLSFESLGQSSSGLDLLLEFLEFRDNLRVGI